MAVRNLVVTLIGRDETSGAFNSAEKSASKLSRAGAAVGTAFAGAAVGGIGVLTAGLVGGFKEAVSYQKITDQLAQTLKATGGVAGVTVDHLKEYAGQLESISGVDEELILNSQNVLATFTGIRNEVGKGNDIYDQASLAALNLSTTLGTDVSGAAVQVGKALNDPTKGITALGKAGVSFTAQQKEQIKAMQASGDTLGAQKIILAELNKEFGGAAAAAGKGFGGTMARLQDTVSDTFREIATKALPTLTKFADYLAANLPGAINRTFSVLGKMRDALAPFIAGVKQAVDVLFRGDVTGGPFMEDGPVINGLFKLREVMGQVIGFIRDNAKPILVGLGAVFLALTAPFTAVAVGLGILYARSETFRNIVAEVATFIRAQLYPAFVTIGQFLVTQIVPVLKSLWATIQSQLLPALRGLWTRIMENKDMFITIGKVIGGVVAVVLIVASKVLTVLIPVLGALIRIGTAVIGKMIGIAGAFFSFANTVISKTTQAVNWVRDKFDALVGFVTGLPGRISGAASGLFDGIKDAFRSAINWVIGAWNGLEFKIPGFDPPGPGPKFGGFTLGVPDIPRLAAGGIVPATPGGRLVRVGEAGQDEAVIPLPDSMKVSAVAGDNGEVVDLLRRILAATEDAPRKSQALQRQFA